MKKSFIQLSILFGLFSTSFSQIQNESSKPEFKYKTEEIIENTTHFRFEIDAAQVSYQGLHVALGSGTRILAYHFVDRLSAEINYNHRWMALLLDKRMVGFTQNESIAPLKGKELAFGLSYSVSKKLHRGKVFMNLKASKTQRTVEELPVNYFRLVDLKLGMLFYDLPGQVKFESTSGINNNIVHFMQNTRCVSFGLSIKRLQNDLFSTENYGHIKSSDYGEFFMDLFYGLGESFPSALYTPVYPGGVYGEPNSYLPVNQYTYSLIKEGMTYNPFGGQIGYKSGSMTSGFGSTISIGFRPGYISQEEVGFLHNLSASLGVGYHFPVRKK